RARPAARTRHPPRARPDRRGARGGHDLDPGGGARAGEERDGMSGNEAEVQARFAATASKIAALEEQRRDALRGRVERFLQRRGDEAALDSGAGTGALAFALAPLVREVVAVDLVPELLAEGERRAAEFPNVVFREGDATRLPFGPASFDLAGTLRT